MLYELMKQLMLGGELQFGEGKIAFMGQRMQLVNSSFFAYRLKYAEDFWKEAQMQYRAMKDANIKGWFEPLRKEKGLKGDELSDWAKKYFNLAGWGKLTVKFSQFLKGRALLQIEDSALAKAYLENFGKSKHPMCHLARGGICSGANDIINRTDIEVVETKCIAQGNPFCEMIIRPHSEFKNPEYGPYKNQISLGLRSSND